MVISYFGLAMVKLQAGDIVVALNPIGKGSAAKAARFGADLALVSLNHPDTNGVAEVTYGEKTPFIIDGPGEYEASGLFVEGLASTGPKGLVNTIYALNFDGMKVVHLGALASADLPAATIEELDTIDILFVPIGGQALAPKDAAKLAASLEPKIIIPLALNGDKSEETLKQFLKEAGSKNQTPVDKLTLRRKELDGKEGEVVILNHD